MAAWSSEDPGDLDKVSHSIFKEDQVHARAADVFVVLLAEELQALLKDCQAAHLVDTAAATILID